MAISKAKKSEKIQQLAGELEIRSPQHAGLEGGFWCPFGHPGDWAPDQRGEDELALCFTSAPMEQRTELLGKPVLRLRLSSERPLAQVAVRLNAVSPDGSSAVLTHGIANLTHRASRAEPEPLEPGRAYDVTVPLQSLGQALETGQRLRLALATCFWPWLWPSPVPLASNHRRSSTPSAPAAKRSTRGMPRPTAASSRPI